MSDLTNIQQLINDKAEKKLNDDINAMIKTIRNIPLLNATEIPAPMMTFGEQTHYPYYIFGGVQFRKSLYDYWLPIYQSREAKLFVDEVDRLKNDVQNLVNGNYENEY